MKIEELHQLFEKGTGITTDTRNLKKGALFFALKGANFNGNKFAEKALMEGCSYAIVDEDEYANGERIIVVENVLLTLQKLANYHRKQFDIPVIGITGSNGKTTTKELTGAVLSKRFNVLVTEGNLNNHLGVPFTLLRLTKEHEIAVIEMGANKPGDIKELVDIAEPDFGVITNVGAAHIEGFGSLQGVIDTKCELYDYIGQNGKMIFYNEEDEILKSRVPNTVTNISYGKGGMLDGELISQDPYVSFKWMIMELESNVLKTNLVGRYNYTNFLLAVTIGLHFKIWPESIDEAILEYVPSNNRSQVVRTKRNTLIVDCYNANATSMLAALKSFVEMDAENKLVILGDMLELGDISFDEHEKIIRFVKDNDLNACLVGTEMLKQNASFNTYENWEQLKENENISQIEETTILLKGSRGIRLESLIPFL